MMKYLQLLFFICIFLQSCENRILLNEISGKYIFENNGSKNVLEIEETGNYTHYQYRTNDKKITYKNKNSWEFFVDKSDRQRLSFNGFTFENIIKGKQKKVGIWVPLIEKHWGDIILCFDSDVGVKSGCFIKIKGGLRQSGEIIATP